MDVVVRGETSTYSLSHCVLGTMSARIQLTFVMNQFPKDEGRMQFLTNLAEMVTVLVEGVLYKHHLIFVRVTTYFIY